MAEKKLWIGSSGPFLYDDNESVQDPDNVVSADQSGMVSEGTIKSIEAPSNQYDLINKNYLETQLKFLSVSSIDDPSTELNAIEGSSVGALVLAYESLTTDNDFTLYSWDDSTSESENVPYTVDGSSGIWIGIAGKYNNFGGSGSANLADIAIINYHGI